MQSMALIHQNLYQDDDLTGINIRAYLTKLTTNLFDTYNIKGEKIKLHLNVSDMVLDVDTMIPLGLIINELITNILKHAFNHQDEGNIHIHFREAENVLLLDISDDGSGMSLDKDIGGSSFGYQLINSLTDQIDGELNIASENGTAVQLKIKDFRQIA